MTILNIYKFIHSKAQIFLFLALFLSGFNATAQELDCEVNVVAPQIQTTEKRVFNSLQNAIREFMNNTKWTQDQYAPNERIRCNISITLSSMNATEFAGTIQMQASRPVYGTNYNSSTFNFMDKNFNFKYTEFQPLEYIKGSYISELTSVLAFYAYMVIGNDFDTYVENGGTSYYNEALAIVNAAQTSNLPGWKSTDKNDRNRWSLVNDRLDQRFVNYRKAWYNYHRLGFDIMQEDLEKGRGVVMETLETLQTIRSSYPFSFLIVQFFDAKQVELINLFAQAPTAEKSKAKDIMMILDIPNAARYEAKLKP